MLTRSGAKLLDFGLAKAPVPIVDGNLSTALTALPRLTVEGTILGTLHYMAPEQLQGREPDARSDLFAFGCVVYEMLTGRRPFEGDTPATVIGSILKDTRRPPRRLFPESRRFWTGFSVDAS